MREGGEHGEVKDGVGEEAIQQSIMGSASDRNLDVETKKKKKADHSHGKWGPGFGRKKVWYLPTTRGCAISLNALVVSSIQDHNLYGPIKRENTIRIRYC